MPAASWVYQMPTCRGVRSSTLRLRAPDGQMLRFLIHLGLPAVAIYPPDS